MWSFLLAAATAATWPEIEIPAPENDGAGDAALVVGIETYPFVDGIPGALDNAEDWYRYLAKARGVAPARIALLRDTEATRERILAGAARAAAEADSTGTVWIVFIGHGAPSLDGKDGVLVGADAQRDPDSLYARSVTRSELLGPIEGTGRRAVAVLDTCFSGTSMRGTLIPGLQPMIPTFALQPSRSVVLTAATGSQFAGPLPGGGGRPAFSYLVLGALTGWGDLDQDGRVTALEAVTYARDAISATVKGRTQTPELIATEPAVVLASGARSRGPDLVELALSGRPQVAVSAELAEDLAPIRVAQEAWIASERRDEARREALDPPIRESLDAKSDAVQSEARAAWEDLSRKLDNGEDALPELEEYVAKYASVPVVEGDAFASVSVPEVELARAYLMTAGGEAEPLRSPAELTPLPRSMAPVELGLPFDGSFKPERLAGSLGDAGEWSVYVSAYHLASHIRSVCPGCDDRVAEAEGLLVEAATYAAALALEADDTHRRQLRYALRGLHDEIRNVWMWASEGRSPIELVPRDASEQWFVGAMERRNAGELQWGILELYHRADRVGGDGLCDRTARRLELRAADASTLGSELQDAGFPTDGKWRGRWTALHAEALGLARGVATCERLRTEGR